MFNIFWNQVFHIIDFFFLLSFVWMKDDHSFHFLWPIYYPIVTWNYTTTWNTVRRGFPLLMLGNTISEMEKKTKMIRSILFSAVDLKTVL